MTPKFIITTFEVYEAVMKEVERLADARQGSNEARYRNALKAAADEWWNARRRRAH
jgi:predicted transcriptional regulator